MPKSRGVKTLHFTFWREHEPGREPVNLPFAGLARIRRALCRAATKPVALAIPRDLPVEQLGGATVYRHGWMIDCRCSLRASNVEALCQLTARRALPLRVESADLTAALHFQSTPASRRWDRP